MTKFHENEFIINFRFLFLGSCLCYNVEKVSTVPGIFSIHDWNLNNILWPAWRTNWCFFSGSVWNNNLKSFKLLFSAGACKFFSNLLVGWSDLIFFKLHINFPCNFYRSIQHKCNCRNSKTINIKRNILNTVYSTFVYQCSSIPNWIWIYLTHAYTFVYVYRVCIHKQQIFNKFLLASCFRNVWIYEIKNVWYPFRQSGGCFNACSDW